MDTTMKPGGVNEANRTVYFDYARVFATLAVMIVHISAQNFASVDVNGMTWQLFNFFDSIVRWGMPVFVMISGALFLERDIPLKKIFFKYILRMAVSFVVWSALYALFTGGTTGTKLLAFVQGHYHMWFILMISGLYLCIPFLKAIVENENRMKYFLALALVFTFVIPEAVIVVHDFGSDLLNKGMSAINSDVTNLNLHMVSGYASYFILGYFLNRITLSKRQRMVVYGLGLVGFIATIGLDAVVAIRTQWYCDHYYGPFTVNVLFEAAAVFTWFKYRTYDSMRRNAFVKKLSQYSFGAYLVHVAVIELLNSMLGWNTLTFPAAIAVPLLAVVVFFCSFALSALLNQIPIVKKYIV